MIIHPFSVLPKGAHPATHPSTPSATHPSINPFSTNPPSINSALSSSYQREYAAQVFAGSYHSIVIDKVKPTPTLPYSTLCYSTLPYANTTWRSTHPFSFSHPPSHSLTHFSPTLSPTLSPPSHPVLTSFSLSHPLLTLCSPHQAGAVWTWGARGSPCLGHGDIVSLQGSWANKINAVFAASTNQTKVMVPFELREWCDQWSRPRKLSQLTHGDHRVVQVAAGDLHTAFLTSHGCLYLCGRYNPPSPVANPPPHPTHTHTHT